MCVCIWRRNEEEKVKEGRNEGERREEGIVKGGR
jgi:hypothetical protein